MSRLTAWIAALLILIGSVWSQEQSLEEGIDESRFGFNLLEPLRRSFCKNFCTSFETMSYIANLACAVKCPELYLPHETTELPTATPLPITTTQNPWTTTMPATTTPATTTPATTTSATTTSATTTSATTMPETA